MFPRRDNQKLAALPLVTWTLVALCIVIHAWDRQWLFFSDQSIVFADLAMRPREVLESWRGPSTDLFPLATLFTALFLHANVLHLAGNVLFLLVFGPAVESALGAYRYALYYLFWGIVAWMAQIYIDPASNVPTLGASGAIGGVLGCYFVLFPSNKIELFVPILPFLAVEVSAWVALGLWFAYQILVPHEGVAAWAHAGGFMAGMATVLIAGGRMKLLANAEPAGS